MRGELPVELTPPAPAPPETGADDPRLGGWLVSESPGPAETRVALVGFPSDEGVRRNGGRPGAAGGPAALRRELYGLTPEPRDPAREPMIELLKRTRDLGDVPVDGDVEADQERLADVLARLLERGVTPVVVGGGHETAFGHFLAYVQAGLGVEIVNWDAHPDVRPWEEGGAHSGSPFRQALEHPSGACRGYSVAGLQPRSVARAHLEYLRRKGAGVLWREETDVSAARELLGRLGGPAMASFDLDAVDRSHAPGVSAPAAGGLTASTWLDIAESCGRTDAVSSVDVVELNPEYDRDGGTAALAAATVWRFLRGLALRGSGTPRTAV
ncbi:MAG: formimidoylglutamase [Candidatus Palauibacterales bacterium]|nr:formimidoylglutamase [Candidatus Palauibacterales bacterium]